MNLLCFDIVYVTEQESLQVKDLAVLFADKYIKKYGEQEFASLLGASGDIGQNEQTNKTMKDFIATLGITHDYPNVVFAFGGVDFSIRAKSKYATYNVRRDWVDASHETNPLVSEKFLMEDYSCAREFFQINTTQMEQYQQHLNLGDYKR